MTLLEALTATRPDGEVADWAECTVWKYRFGQSNLLVRCPNGVDSWHACYIDKDLLTRTDFTPMWDTPAPMVPKAGEVWETDTGYRCWVHNNLSNKYLLRTWIDGIVGQLEDKMIHGQSGWRLIYSPDPERMRRVQG